MVVNYGGPDIASALQGNRLVANHALRATDVSTIADFDNLCPLACILVASQAKIAMRDTRTAPLATPQGLEPQIGHG